MHEKTFQCLVGSNYQGLQCLSVSQVRSNPFEDQTLSISCRLAIGFTFFNRVEKQPKMVLEMFIVQEGTVSTERIANLLTVM